MPLVSRPRWGNVAAGGAVAVICGGILVSMASLGRTTPLVLFAGLGVPVGVALALTRSRRCRACSVAADEGAIPVSSTAADPLRAACASQNTDEVARLLEAPSEPPYLVVKYGFCRACRQAARLTWKGGGGAFDGPIAGPVVGALEERRRVLRSAG